MHKNQINKINVSRKDKESILVQNFRAKYDADQEANSGRDGTGYRSPCFSQQGSSSPAVQGRSVRDFEEQMSALRKENFNLKLRLYFLEESIPGYQSQAESQESTMKQLIDNKIEMEMLRKEIQEKQEILKEAAQAITQMEQLQKDTEAKAQATIDELTLKLKTAECNLEMSHSQTGDLFGQNTDTTVDVLENYNAIQKVTELQAANRQTELKLRDFQSQINQLDDILKKRDETINSYEGRLQELSYTNAELLEQLQLKHKQLCNSERIITDLRSLADELKEQNHNLMRALKSTQDNYCSEIISIKNCEKQMLQQQEILSKLQSTISIKTANTKRLLEKIQDYEKAVAKMDFERNLAKRENRFFRSILGKLHTGSNECITFEQEHYFGHMAGKHVDDICMMCEHSLAATGGGDYPCDFHTGYKLNQKLSVNYYNRKSVEVKPKKKHEPKQKLKCATCNEYIDEHSEPEQTQDLQFVQPIKFILGDGDYDLPKVKKTDSCSSMHENLSSTTVLNNNHSLPTAFFKVTW